MILQRKRDLCESLLNDTEAKIGFLDVGSGGELKHPWNLLPNDCVEKINFEPTDSVDDELPTCVSNHSGIVNFHIAEDERGSSLHEPSAAFMKRYPHWSNLKTKKVVKVQCRTLDELFADSTVSVDVIDVNAEGHDFQVLEGAIQLLAIQSIKLIKVEFEFVEVWHGQGWFSDTDRLLRDAGFVLKDVNVERLRPAGTELIDHAGEVLWGKALYTPTLDHLSGANKGNVNDELKKAIVLFVLNDLIGSAFDAIGLGEDAGVFDSDQSNDFRRRIAAIYEMTASQKLQHLIYQAIRRILGR